MQIARCGRSANQQRVYRDNEASKFHVIGPHSFLFFVSYTLHSGFMLRVKRDLCSSQVSLSNLSFLLFERLTVPRDLVQKLSALWRPHQNCPSFSRQLELPIRFVLFSLVWAWAV
jgi:hypothetical protein